MTTPTQRHILRHSLGLDRSSIPYRNRYCPGGKDVADCEALAAAGLMTEVPVSTEMSGGARIFRVTDAGREVAHAKEEQA